MENEQWPAKYEQSVNNMTSLESTDDDGCLNNGNGNDNTTNNTEISKNNSAGTDNDDDIKERKSTGNFEKNSINYHVSENAKQIIQLILEKVRSLSSVEKILLRLKLSEVSNGIDPLKQPLNPLGSRSEINRTIAWIKTHLKEDPDTSLPKQEVYDEYHEYCAQNNIKPLSQADFGKVMKQVYPNVRARRLGTRGNSRYCYSGLRRCIKLKVPILPDLADKPMSTEIPCSESNLTEAAWLIVKEWSEQQFKIQFSSLQTLACYLIINHSIGFGTQAANQLIQATENNLINKNEKTSLTINNNNNNNNTTGNRCNNHNSGNKHREMQLQLQRKIQQKNERTLTKRKMNSKNEQKINTKKLKQQQQQQQQLTNVIIPNLVNDTILQTTLKCESFEGSNSPTSSSTATTTSQGKSVCDKLLKNLTQLPTSLPDFKSFQKSNNSNEQISNSNNNNSSPTGKVAIPRLIGNKQLSPVSKKLLQQQQQQQHQQQLSKNQKYKAIQPKLITNTTVATSTTTTIQPICDITSYNNNNNNTSSLHNNSSVIDITRSQDVLLIEDNKKTVLINNTNSSNNSEDNNNNTNDCDDDEVPDEFLTLPRERLNSISNVDKDAMDEYLGTNNSQHEEELSKYFNNNNNNNNNNNSNEETITETDNTKLSQLRQLLEQNCITDNKISNQLTTIQTQNNIIPYIPITSTVTSSSSSSQSMVIGGVVVTAPSTGPLNIKRRVSFETSIQDNEIPPSPNTRRKNFSFTPISPGPQSPNGRQSKCSSTNVSPFVSPRNTPIPRIKNNTHQNAGIMLLQQSTPIITTNSGGNGGGCKKLINNTTTIKIKKEIDLDLTATPTTNFINFTAAMSAPASPMLSNSSNNNNNNNNSVLQKLLNSNSKVLYKPDYNNSTATITATTHLGDRSIINSIDGAQPSEISHFFPNDSLDISNELNYHHNQHRSQSVPLNQMLKSNYFIDTSSNSAVVVGTRVVTTPISVVTTNDFNDLDPIQEENENVNRIINSLDNEQQQNAIFNLDLNHTQCLPSFDLIISSNNNNESCNNNDLSQQQQQQQGIVVGGGGSSNSNSSVGLYDSTTTDGVNDLNCELKFNPSRSVPNTPLPFLANTTTTNSLNNNKLIKRYNQNLTSSRSYPSTPLLQNNDTTAFNYTTINNDCLLNGQPIRINNNKFNDYFLTAAASVATVATRTTTTTNDNNNSIQIRNSIRNDDDNDDNCNNVVVVDSSDFHINTTLNGDFDLGDSSHSLIDDNGILIDEQNCNGHI